MEIQDIILGRWYVVTCFGRTFATQILHKERESVLIHDGDNLVRLDPKDVVSPAEIVNEH